MRTNGPIPDMARDARNWSATGAEILGISREEEDLLAYACRHHSGGMIDADITVQACWDADRLDLGRVGIPLIPPGSAPGAARDLLKRHAGWFEHNNRKRPRWADLGWRA